MATRDETLSDLKLRLAQYLTAEAAILKGQSYTIKDMTMTRANLDTVKKTINELQQQINQIEGGGIRIQLGVPMSN